MKRAFIVLTLVLISLTGCQSEPDVEDIDGWIRNAKFNKVNELLGNPEIKQELRLKSLSMLVEYGSRTRLQSALEAAHERDALIPLFQQNMVSMLNHSDLKMQIEAKNALLTLRRYLTDEEQDSLIGEIAKWGFAGLKEDTPRDELIKTLQKREVAGGLSGMKRHGLKVAAWLVRYGVSTESLVPYLSEAKEPSDQIAILDAAKKLFSMEKIKPVWSLIDAVRHFPIPDTIEFLVDLYLSDRFDDVVKESSIAAVQDLVYDKIGGKSVSNTPVKRRRVLAAVKRLMKSHSTTDRWDAAEMMLHIGGVEELSSVIDSFEFDGRAYKHYNADDEIENPDDVIIQLCNDRMRPSMDISRPVLEDFLSKGNEAQKSISILCLKVLAQPASIAKLETLKKDETSLEKFFFYGQDLKKRVTAIEKKGSKYKRLTVGLLARNAIDGIKVHGEIARAVQSKKMGKREAKLRTRSVNSVFFVAGKNFREAVEQAYRRLKDDTSS